MSKEAALRAMREARYAARTGAPSAPARPARAAAPVEAATRPASGPAGESETDGLCGHRSMNGRTCTREQGHAAKSHRYS